MEDAKKIFFMCDGDVPECKKTGCYKRGGECMRTSDVRHAVNIADAIPNMSDMDKGCFLGYAEALANRKEQEEKHEGAKQD